MAIIELTSLMNRIVDKVKNVLNVNATIRDATNPNYVAQVTAAGELKVSTPPPAAPPDTTPVNKGNTTIVSKHGGRDIVTYTITNGKTLVLQNYRGGGMTPVGKCVLGIDIDGDGIIDEQIAIGYIGGDNNFSFVLSTEIVGDGTKQIISYAENDDNGSNHEMSHYWSGYEK